MRPFAAVWRQRPVPTASICPAGPEAGLPEMQRLCELYLSQLSAGGARIGSSVPFWTDGDIFHRFLPCIAWLGIYYRSARPSWPGFSLEDFDADRTASLTSASRQAKRSFPGRVCRTAVCAGDLKSRALSL